jgi:hypothetical protein
MRIKIFEFNRYSETPEKFESRVRSFIETAHVTEMKLWENLSNSEVVFQFTLGSDDTVTQEFNLWAFISLEDAEAIANSTLEAVVHAGLKAQHLNVISLSKSNRAVMAMVVQGESGPHGIPTSQDNEEASPESNPTAHEVSDSRAKRGLKHRDRKAAS